MEVIIATMIVFGLMTFAMSIGVLINGRSLKGSCGGITEDCSCSNTEKIKCKLKIMMDAKSN